jgi:hypothetical protein
MNNSIKFENFDVGYSPLAEGFQPAPKALVFRDKHAWARFWASSSFVDVNLQKLPAPDVNFARYMVIAFTPGSRPTGGFSVSIDDIAQVKSSQENRWIIYYTEIVPGQNCLVTQQPTTPAVFVLTEQSDASIDFEGRKITSSCYK